jgi:hypothetical protein
MPAYGVGSPSSALLAARIKLRGFQETPGVMPVLRFLRLLGKVGDYKICTAVIVATDFEHGAAVELEASPPGE